MRLINVLRTCNIRGSIADTIGMAYVITPEDKENLHFDLL
jgi:hypothetical protein